MIKQVRHESTGTFIDIITDLEDNLSSNDADIETKKSYKVVLFFHLALLCLRKGLEKKGRR